MIVVSNLITEEPYSLGRNEFQKHWKSEYFSSNIISARKKNKIEIDATSVTLQIRDYMDLLQFMLQKK